MLTGSETKDLRDGKPQERSDSADRVTGVGARQARGREQGSGVRTVSLSRPEAGSERAGEHKALRGAQLGSGNNTLKGKTP